MREKSSSDFDMQSQHSSSSSSMPPLTRFQKHKSNMHLRSGREKPSATESEYRSGVENTRKSVFNFDRVLPKIE